MAYCENCGTKIESNPNFCSECGARIEQINIIPIAIKKVPTNKKEDISINIESNEDHLDFSNEFGLKDTPIDFNPTNSTEQEPPKIIEESVSDTEIDESKVRELGQQIKEFAERTAEIKNEDDIQWKDIGAMVDLAEKIEEVTGISLVGEKEKESNPVLAIVVKVLGNFLNLILTLLGIAIFLYVVFFLIIKFYPDAHFKNDEEIRHIINTITEWIKNIF